MKSRNSHLSNWKPSRCYLVLAFFTLFSAFAIQRAHASDAQTVLSKMIHKKGIILIADDKECKTALAIAKNTEYIIYVQLDNDKDVIKAQRAADSAGLYGTRIYVEKGAYNKLHFADNLADALLLKGKAKTKVTKKEALRAINPLGFILKGGKVTRKQPPKGVDDWAHPYHGPDNNPLSKDKKAVGPYFTQFLAKPYYVPFPTISVSAGGRMFKAFGHITWKRRERPWLDMLIGMNAYNGEILWKMKLPKSFMVHRNMLIATADTLYLADNKSCKLIDAATGKIKDEITIPKGEAAGTFWKWIALENDTLYALVGKEEPADISYSSKYRVQGRAGWVWSGLGGHYNTKVREKGRGEQPDPNKWVWGFGKTLFAINPKTKKVLWKYTADKLLDSRGICMKNGKIFAYSEKNSLTCIDAKTGKVLWENKTPELITAIGPHAKRQSWRTGYWTSSYLKCTNDAVYFTGVQRTRVVAVSAKDGKILWIHKAGNFHSILHEKAFYGMGQGAQSVKLDLLTGKSLGKLNLKRGNCTRATANTENIFVRGGGTKMLDFESEKVDRISSMRPACMDGVIPANGHLYWGPWMCDCNLSLVGIIGLAPAKKFNFEKEADESKRLEVITKTPKLTWKESEGDWTNYRSTPACGSYVACTLPEKVNQKWAFKMPDGARPTAPVIANGRAFIGADNGVVYCIDTTNGKPLWKAYTSGAIRFSPAIWKGRVYAGSSDGYIYCFNGTTGKTIWRFRAAPIQRRISIYGRICSNWPVASGVIVDKGILYAAAGIANYDGTHVYALNAESGKIVWQNNKSHLWNDETLSEYGGASVSGHMLLFNDRLYLASGNVYSPISYDIKTGETIKEKMPTLNYHNTYSWRARDLMQFKGVVYNAGYIMYTDDKALDFEYFYNKPPYLAANNDKMSVRHKTVGWNARLEYYSSEELKKEKPTPNFPIVLPKKAKQGQHITTLLFGLAVADNATISFGVYKKAMSDKEEPKFIIGAISMTDGKLLWKRPLPSAPIRWGAAIDKSGQQVIISLRNGTILCLGTEK